MPGPAYIPNQPTLVVDIVAEAIETVTREDVAATPEGEAYLVAMTPAAVARLMEQKGLETVDVIRVTVGDRGVMLRTTGRRA